MIENADYQPRTVAAQDLKFGDLWNGREIRSADPKDTWTYIEAVNADGDVTKKKFRNGDAVSIYRETEASQNARYAAERRVRMNGKIADWFGRYQPRRATNKAHAKINEVLAHEGALVDGYLLGQLVEAQAADKVAARVHQGIEAFTLREAGRGPYAEVEDLFGMAEYMAEEFRRSVLQIRALSRSTSVLDNVMEDADRAAEAEYLRRYESTWF